MSEIAIKINSNGILSLLYKNTFTTIHYLIQYLFKSKKEGFVDTEVE